MVRVVLIRTAEFTAGVLLVGWAIADSSWVMIKAVILRRARARYPEIFDGELALQSIEEELKEQVQLWD